MGAIVRGPDCLMVVQDIRNWDPPDNDPLDREIRYVDRVRSALGIEQVLCTPPRAVETDGTVTGWIPALRFPTWMRCNNCGLMHASPWRKTRTQSGGTLVHKGELTRQSAVCEGQGCSGTLEQFPWVLVHEDGHLADVPWHTLAHGDSRNPEHRQCRPDWSRPYLRLFDTDNGRRLSCTRCNSSTPFSLGAFSRVAYPPREWQQPWFRVPPTQSPDALALLVEINDVRVHAHVTQSALIIPPESRIRRGTVTDRLYSNTKSLERIRNAKSPLARKGLIQRLATEFRCNPADIEEANKEIKRGYPLYGKSVTASDLLADEYHALIEVIPDLGEDEDFVTEHHTDAWNGLGGTTESEVARQTVRAINRLVAVNRLKEVMVLKGFRRAGGERLVPPDLTGECNWLPALEMYGEGIFFTLDEAQLQLWEEDERVRNRARAFAERYVKRNEQNALEVEVSPRFLLCHTLAHLLIRKLDAEAGYPAASLKERIYCQTGGKSMAGILIYVAVPDEEGSLGGLMELAQPESFLRLLTGAFEAAAWCSLDPVCAEQEGHGPDLLNRAACHACVLVPETSCSFGNVLLDRTFVKGAMPDIPPYLGFAAAYG